jgi:hypothetical protein
MLLLFLLGEDTVGNDLHLLLQQDPDPELLYLVDRLSLMLACEKDGQQIAILLPLLQLRRLRSPW